MDYRKAVRATLAQVSPAQAARALRHETYYHGGEWEDPKNKSIP